MEAVGHLPAGQCLQPACPLQLCIICGGSSVPLLSAHAVRCSVCQRLSCPFAPATLYSCQQHDFIAARAALLTTLPCLHTTASLHCSPAALVSVTSLQCTHKATFLHAAHQLQQAGLHSPQAIQASLPAARASI